MAYTTINKSTDYFNTKTFTGNGSSQSITSLDFKPSLVWLKNRDSGYSHSWFDLHRGNNARIRSNSASGQDNPSPSSLTAFNSDGFTVGGDIGVNANNEGIVGWNWYSADTMGSANTDGSLNTYATTANTTAGFSIISYTGNGTSGATVGHGLGVVPKMIIVKALTGSNNWAVYHASIGATKYLRLNATDAQATSTARWNDTAPTSSVFSLGNDGEVNTNGSNYIAYCFAEKTGYSKIGSYTGNASTDGPMIYTGFRPSWFMFKRTDTADGWMIMDDKRNPFNVVDKRVEADSGSAEYTGADWFDFVSNGVKIRNSSGGINASGGTYIYMAFGQSLVGSNNVPCTAR